ncbi:Ribulosamine/erythrulosamine 3-kinase potentially involved in protein deglycation [Indibacter alkaliphilus LW1]|jgi:protein-ribulosamine 3-kinase|uniref:Ribulosamine/erythrulosamine 3-kinase potentially involved in protein deglycation n=1 Tax=Indibacter alkaliphilus (strain CCUG 57479 / KCTC 22604 / LW1) TaxID=1189612 RepID=S2DR07_INDAL|nr:fructosamine kinase family protein [Indibacter alkaliphilus]EOZ92338.1 Ribulosamine/erythrulosamine 3-kinase potentially involved in protein deglycation [Indibacter alkaliphilus LW1]
MFDNLELFNKVIFRSLGRQIPIAQAKLIAAGTINQGIFIETSDGNFFLKLNFQPKSDIFEKESEGLKVLKKNTPLQVPEVFGFGKIGDQNYLLMEWIQSGRGNGSYWKELGLGLAQMHMASQADFGFETDNYIASLDQQNSSKGTWADFFVENRLEPMIGKAYYEGLVDLEFYKRFQKTYPLMEKIFPKERPALIHGDLWSGNIMSGTDGTPVLIDPAVYYGHREMDLAFSRLFGGFDEEFYEAYHTLFPLEPDFQARIPVYNLYPLLVHLLLFGKSYLSGIKKTVDKLLG